MQLVGEQSSRKRQKALHGSRTLFRYFVVLHYNVSLYLPRDIIETNSRHCFHSSDVIIDPMPSNKMESLPSANKARDREPVIPVSCVNLSSDDRDLAQKLEAIAQVRI